MRRFGGAFILLLVCLGAVVAQEPQSAVDYYNRGVDRYNAHDVDGAIADWTSSSRLRPRTLMIIRT